MELVKISVNKEKAKSILKMVEVTLEMIEEIDSKFSSNIVKGYYDVIRELISVVLLLDGYKTYGEGSHRGLIEYLGENCKEIDVGDISLLEDLRVVRNKISYDGFFVEEEYLKMRIGRLKKIILKLKGIIKKKL